MKIRITFVLLLTYCTSFCQKIVFDGDSNTRGEFIEAPGYFTGNTDNYANQTLMMVNGVTGVNVGINSETSFGIASSMTTKYPALIDSNTIYSLFIGINDFGLMRTASEVFTNVKAIMAYVRTLGCSKIILSTYPPSDRVPVGGSQDLERLAYNQMLRDSINLYGYKLAEVAMTPQFSNFNQAYYADNIHWNIQGCYVIAKKIAEQIKNYAGITTPANGTWLGLSSDIGDPANWQGGIPGWSSHVFINSNTPYQPNINGTLNCANLFLENGITVSGTLKVSRTIIGPGTISTDPSGTVELNGAQGQVLFGNAFANNTVSNLKINNGAGVSLSGKLDIVNALYPTYGIFTTNNSLTLKSSSAGSAMVLEGPSNYNYISGNVTVERFLGIPTAKRSWRLVTTPLRSATGNGVSIFDNWQLGGAMGAVGKGTLITGPGADSQTNGLDFVSGSSLKTFDGMGLVPVTNTKNASLFTTAASGANKSYFVFVRGDRSTSNLFQTSPTTLSSVGELQTGDQVFATNPTPGGLTLIGNPYASPLDLELVRNDNVSSNIKPNFYVWNHSLGSNGGFVTVTYIDSAAGYNVIPQGVGDSSIIQSGQAFFVQTNISGTGSSTITIKETHKSNSSVNYGFRNGSQMEMLSINLASQLPDSTFHLIDGVLARYRNNYQHDLGDDDAIKMKNVGENISLQRFGQDLSIEGRPLIYNSDTLFIGLTNLKENTSYKLAINPSNFNVPTLAAYLEDSYLQTSKPLSLQNETSILFQISADTASFSNDRFKVVFKSITTLPVNLITINSAVSGKNIKVNWSVQTGKDITRFELEKSTDGTHFSNASVVIADAASDKPGNYAWIDNAAVKGLNYYRIKAIDIAGKIQYSSISITKISNVENTFSIFPNPVKGNSMNVLFNSEEIGEYNLRLTNASGQSVYTNKVFNHTAGTQKIYLKNKLQPGLYHLEIRNSKTQGTVVLPVFVR